jgi:hypothetical protein
MNCGWTFLKIIQNYWVFGLHPSSGILITRETTFRKLDLFSSSGEEETPTLLRPLERVNPSHWTEGQSARLSWNEALIRDLWPDFYYCQTLAGVCWCGALSLTRGRVCHLQLLLALASSVILGSESHGTRDYILLSQIRDSPLHRLLRLAGLRWT